MTRPRLAASIAVVVVAAVALLIGVSLRSRDPVFTVARFEPPDLGVAVADSLPMGRVVEGTFLIASVDPGREPTYTVCLPSRTGSGQVACLFTSRLAGAPDLQVGSGYRLRAVFDSLGDVPVGRMFGAVPAAPVFAGPVVEKSSRFAEESEALSTWMGRNRLSGYLRADGVYVWYRPDDTAGNEAAFGVFGPITSVWVSAVP